MLELLFGVVSSVEEEVEDFLVVCLDECITSGDVDSVSYFEVFLDRVVGGTVISETTDFSEACSREGSVLVWSDVGGFSTCLAFPDGR